MEDLAYRNVAHLSGLARPSPSALALPGANVAAGGTAPLPALAITRLRLSVRLERSLQLPMHAGALLRSVFGVALRQGACTTGLPQCGECPLLRDCAYPSLFETPARPTQFEQRFSHVPNPYVIEPPPGPAHLPAGSVMVFYMVLAGEAARGQLPLVVTAWQRALRAGLGQARVPGRLLSVDAVDLDGRIRPAYDLERGLMAAALPALDLAAATAALVPPGASPPSALCLQIDAPLRLQHESRPLLPSQLTPRTFMSHLLRRANLMLDLHLGIRPAPFDARALLAIADDLVDDRSRLRWYDQRRYSARQGQELPQGGVVGAWSWAGPVAPLLPWLLVGQWLHVGKGATAGLGAYSVSLSLAGRAK